MNPHDEALAAKLAKAVGDSLYGYVDPNETPNTWSEARGCVNTLLSALRDAGMVVVPLEPTEAMLSVKSVEYTMPQGECVVTVDGSMLLGAWNAMVAAAVAGGTEDAG